MAKIRTYKLLLLKQNKKQEIKHKSKCISICDCVKFILHKMCMINKAEQADAG